MIKKISVVVVLLFTSFCGASELMVTELEKQPPGISIRELIELADGQVLLRIGPRIDRTVGYLLTSEGRVKRRLDHLGSECMGVVSYRSGFACQYRADADARPRPTTAGDLEQTLNRATGIASPTKVVAFDLTTDKGPITIFEGNEGYHSMSLLGVPGSRDLFVLESGIQDYQLTRIDEQARIAWQKSLQRVEAFSPVATADGVAYVQWGSPQEPLQVLRSLDRDGRLRWETPLPTRFHGSTLYAPAGFIALLKSDRSGQRMALFDAGSGKLIADADVPPYRFARGTRQGVLLSGTMSGQGFVGMLGRDGKLSWLRRYAMDARVNHFQQALLTRDDKLMLISHQEEPPTLSPITSIVVTDATATSLSERSRCLDSRWKLSLELEARLHSNGLFMWPKKAPPTADASCNGQDSQIIEFMSTLAGALPANMTIFEKQRIFISVNATGQAIHLENYQTDWSHYPSAMVALLFSVPPDRAGELARLIAGPVQTHLNRMAQLHSEFKGMTGFHYIAEGGATGNILKTFADLETAARGVNRAIATIPGEALADFRKNGTAGWVSILLRADGFGQTHELHAVQSADQTLLRIAEENRRNAQQGNIDIRD